MGKIINVANRLPVTINDSGIKKSSGGLVSALDGVGGEYDLQWIGWPGTSFKSAFRGREINKQLRREYGWIPIFLSEDDISKYYQGFSNSSLWPMLHYMSNYVHNDESWWSSYKRVNKYFAEAVAESCNDDDMVWIHDYHLMLVPQMLREMRPNVKSGFFLHTPFPSYEIFRCHPHRAELLEGVLGADLIGFHTFGYMRHFRSSVMRILGLESEIDSIMYNNRCCKIGVYPIGANTQSFVQEMKTDRYKQRYEHFAQIYKGKKIILGVERLDYTKGLPRRLEAIDRFLSEWNDKDNIVFIFIGIPSRGEVSEYQELREIVEQNVGRVNGRHGSLDNIPVHFIHQSVPFTDLCALYSLADVAMVTPLIDGMNLVAKEYVACKQAQAGVLLLSEFAGAAEELFKAVPVNPYDADGMCEALKMALSMDEEEKSKRMHGMYERVVEYDAQYWAKSFLNDLNGLNIKRDDSADILDAQTELKKRFSAASKIACFLDYDGTLREFVKDPKMASPTDEIMDLLNKIEKIPNIDTYIISGRGADNLDEWFTGRRFTLVAEHGYRFRKHDSNQWKLLSESFDLSWKKSVTEILEKQTGTTPGSFVEEKASAIVWHYRRSDPEFGKWKAQQLLYSLYEMVTNLPVEVHHGKKIVEVSSMQVSKGAAIERLVRDNDYDLIFCVGDDQTDETMFRVEDKRLISVKVGPGETRAQLRVKSPDHFRKVLSGALDSVNPQ